MSFTGSVGASGYKLSVTDGNNNLLTDRLDLIIPQPEGYDGSEKIVDTTILGGLLSAKPAPDSYRIGLYAMAPADMTGIVLDSQVAGATFVDRFRFDAVDKSTITVDTSTPNTVKVSWAPVPGVTKYKLSINGSIVDAEKTTDVDITAYAALGSNLLSITCLGDGKLYIDSKSVAKDDGFLYKYSILDTGEVTFEYLGGESIRLTIPQFDAHVKNYALQFGDQAHIYEAVAADGVLTFDATFKNLPKYTETVITITAGVTGWDFEKDDFTYQENIKKYSQWTVAFTNNYVIDAPVLSIENDAETGHEVLLFDLEPTSLNSIERLEWQIYLGGRKAPRRSDYYL